MANFKLFLVALFGALLCAGTARQLPAATEDSKIDIGLGLAPPPGTLVAGINDTINIGTPGLTPPPGNLVTIGTNNTVTVPLPQVPALPPLGFSKTNAAETVNNIEASSTTAATDDSKIDIGLGLAPPPGTLVVGINDTINIGTPGLAPPPSNLVSIGTNNTITVPLPHVPLPPVGLLTANAKAVHSAEGSSTAATTDDSKIDIGIDLAPPPGMFGFSLNDTINVGTPGLAPPPRNHVGFNTNDTVPLGPLPVPLPPLVP